MKLLRRRKTEFGTTVVTLKVTGGREKRMPGILAFDLNLAKEDPELEVISAKGSIKKV